MQKITFPVFLIVAALLLAACGDAGSPSARR